MSDRDPQLRDFVTTPGGKMEPAVAPPEFAVGDEVHIARIDFTGTIERVGPTRDPVIVLVAKGGAELVMRASALAREAPDAR